MADKWANQTEPSLVDKREQVLDPMTAYQITSMMEGVVQRGTATVVQGGRQADRRQDRHHQRREGRLVHRLLARPRGRRLSSATTSRAIWAAAAPPAAARRAPIVRDFMKVALADKPAVPFRVPAGIKLIRIDAEDRHAPRAARAAGGILEAFKPGTAPPERFMRRRRSRRRWAKPLARCCEGYPPEAGSIPRPFVTAGGLPSAARHGAEIGPDI